MYKIFKYIAILVVTTLTLLIISIMYLPVTKKQTNIEIKSGYGVIKICNIIPQNSSISNKKLFCFTSRIYDFLFGTNFYPGKHTIKANAKVFDIIDELSKEKIIKITIPEGLTKHEVLEILNSEKGLKGEVDLKDVEEGFLMPETYIFSHGTERKDVIKKMEGDMRTFLEKEWSKREQHSSIQTIEKAVILASIVQKESSDMGEYSPTVASVYLNRLKITMHLGACPTVIYAITNGKSSTLNRALTFNDLNVKSPYNTYKKYGLPPSAICNPSKVSIMAVLHPNKTDYLYFTGYKGKMSFSTRHKEHINKKAEINQRRKELKQKQT